MKDNVVQVIHNVYNNSIFCVTYFMKCKDTTFYVTIATSFPNKF